MEMPSYTDVLGKVEMAVSKFLAMEAMLTPNEILAWEVQSLIVVAAQTMMPPLRGRPYWDLEIENKGSNSMLHKRFPPFLSHVCHFLNRFSLPFSRESEISNQEAKDQQCHWQCGDHCSPRLVDHFLTMDAKIQAIHCLYI